MADVGGVLAAHRPYADITTIHLNGREVDIDLGSSAAEAIWVVGN